MTKKTLLLIIALIIFGNNSNAQTEPKTEIKKPTQVFTAKPSEKSNSPEAVKLLNSGIDHRLKKEYELAAQDFTEAIRLDPQFAAAYKHRAALYLDAKKEQLALADLKRAIELAPKDSINYINRAGLYLRRKDYKRAIADYTKLIEMEPEMELWYSFRADAYEGAGKPKMAATDREKVKELRSKAKNNNTFDKSN